jgi:hypothetical protein
LREVNDDDRIPAWIEEIRMKSGKLNHCLLLSAFALFTAATAAAQHPQPASEANYPVWTVLSHKLEGDPLSPALNKDAEMAVQELSASSDFHTPLCNSFFSFFNKLTTTGYPYQAQIYRLYILGSATYHIETGKTDPYGTNLYAFTSVLKGYSTILSHDPVSRDKVMDSLLVTDLKGKLPDLLKKDNTCREQ